MTARWSHHWSHALPDRSQGLVVAARTCNLHRCPHSTLYGYPAPVLGTGPVVLCILHERLP